MWPNPNNLSQGALQHVARIFMRGYLLLVQECTASRNANLQNAFPAL